ncbi:hypothetical protein ASE63_17425 [Bosea sp. Root381]|uniref:SPOR domain-containing protein n=1 Tax=Bosea sp. Root381 TaxID=1736524 RepID=UPI0006F61E5E|nr:SPOR domain-containing protein [Bosea sp. Root381]KRE15026.1 hypothetical protein ASE63_17425 [Bosea sp. Root381]
MSEPARNRFALDLEDLERQLRSAGQAPKAGPAADPLAELTRIVDQGDPLRDIFSHRGQAAAPQRSPASWQAQAPTQARREPQPQIEPVRPVLVTNEQPTPPAELRGALDEFEALLRRTDAVARQAPAPTPAAAVPARAEPRFAPEPESFEPSEPQLYQRPAAMQGQVHVPRDLDDEREPYPYHGQQGYEQQGYEQQHYEQQHYEQEPPFAAPQAHAELPADDAMPVLRTRRSRRGLWAAAAVIAVGVIGVGVSMSLRGPTTPSDGQPPTITADASPTKVEPVNPGGKEIPNQNKQIYERSGEAVGGTKVVSSEEQPIDVQQAARSMQPRAALPAVGSGVAATPAANVLAQAPATIQRDPLASEPMLTPVPPVPGLGEPRRVRTVTIRPDGTPAPPPNSDASYTNGTLPNTTGSAPAVRPGAIDTAMAQPRPRPAVAAEQLKVQERVAAPAPATTPAATPYRVANAPAAAQAPAAPAAPATAALRSGTGDFVVQLAAPGSESEARATFAALQRKYPGQLTGQAPIVRKTELAGGKTVYRLRVGPYSREDATTMCTQLQSAGGQCFIAKN